MVFVGGEVDLHAVQARLGKRQRRQGGPQVVAHRQRVVILALVIAGDDQLVEPLREPLGLEQGATGLLGPRLRRVEDQPALGQVVPVQIVEVIALQVDVHVALIRQPCAVGVLPLPPRVFGKHHLRHVPAPQGRVEGVEVHLRALRYFPLQSQAVTVSPVGQGEAEQRGAEGKRPPGAYRQLLTVSGPSQHQILQPNTPRPPRHWPLRGPCRCPNRADRGTCRAARVRPLRRAHSRFGQSYRCRC